MQEPAKRFINSMKNKRLPSTFQPDDCVGLQSLIDLLQKARDARVVSVSFTDSKVKYNLAVPVSNEDGTHGGFFRMANIDSAFLHAPIDNDFHYNDQVAIESRRQAGEVLSSVDHAHRILDGSWHTAIEKNAKVGDEVSESVLIDTDGTRRFFTIGWYDFGQRKWISNDGEELNEDQLVWQLLPLSKYDK